MIFVPAYAKLSLAGLGLLAGVVEDLRLRKVRNQVSVVVLVVGLTFVGITEGGSGLINSVVSMMTAMACILPLYVLRALGGGDVKIFVAVASLLSWKAVLITILSSMIWGSLLGLFQVILKGQFKQFAENLLGIFMRSKPRAENLHKIPFTVALMFGFLTSLVWTGGVS